MKKKLACMLAILMLGTSLCACAAAAPAAENPEGLQIVCTIFPAYDWLEQVLGPLAVQNDVTLLLKNGTDMHSYQPTAQDIIKVSGCDLFIYVGGESDLWVQDALREEKNQDMVALNLLQALGASARAEEVQEGMQQEEEEETGETVYDEHVWLSLKNAVICTRAISAALEKLDAANAQTYAQNADAYCAKLQTLDQAYAAAVAAASKDTLLFADRFPFLYLTKDYDLKYYAAFPGCSAETEASFATVAFLAGKVDELGLCAVLTIEGAQHAIAQTVVQNTMNKDQTILVMDSMQSVSKTDQQQGTTYLSVMESNLSVLQEALA